MSLVSAASETDNGVDPHPWRTELRATALLATPIVVGQLCVMGQNLVDVLLAGHLDAHVLASVAIGGSVWGLALMTSYGMSYALPPAVAQLDGAGRRTAVGAVFRQALWLALAVGLALMVLVRWGGPELVRASGVSPSLQPDAAAFLRAISFGAPALSLYLTCRGFSEGLSMPRPSMAFGVLGLLLLAPIGYVLMYGRLGVPMLGARGSGIATAIVTWLQLAGIALWLACSGRYRGIGWGLGRRLPDPQVIAGLLRVGVPIAVSQLLESSLFTTAALVIGGFGEAAAGGHQIAISIAAFTFMVPMGLSFAITVRVGNAAGRGDPVGVRRAGFSGMGLALALQVASSAVLLGLPDVVAGWYTNDPEVVARATLLLRLAGVFQFSDALQVTASGALRGLKDTKAVMLVTGFAYWVVGMPVGVWLATRAGLQAPGMWIGLIAGLTVAAVLLCRRFVRITAPVGLGQRAVEPVA